MQLEAYQYLCVCGPPQVGDFVATAWNHSRRVVGICVQHVENHQLDVRAGTTVLQT